MKRLTSYGKKRKLHQTPEPHPRVRKSGGRLIFVVQKHHASHLHYDLRLEVDGVLKSWAVPKGPSMDPEEKRLAILVEDHPYEYKDFEGEIPEGNYGAGTVKIWDHGTYDVPELETHDEIESYMRAGLKKGHVHICFHGRKLKGEFSLFMVPRASAKNAWLLVKKK